MKSQAEIRIRNWTKEDFPIVKNILLETWKNTYTFIPEEDILNHFEKHYSEGGLIEILNDPFSKGIIAEVNSVPVGWLKLFEDLHQQKILCFIFIRFARISGFRSWQKIFE